MAIALTNPGELGWGIKSIGRGLKKAAKKTGKFTYKVTKKSITAPVDIAKKIPVAGSLVKMGEKLAKLPLKFLIKAALGIGRTFCKAPPLVLEAACRAANVDPSFVPLFCKLVKEKKFSLGAIKRVLPPALKVASKMAAAGMFPPIVPALAVVKRIPFVGRYASSEGPGPDNAVVRQAMQGLEILAVADYLGLVDPQDLGAMGLGPKERTALRSVLAGAVESGATDKKAVVLGGVTIGATILGFYLLFR